MTTQGHRSRYGSDSSVLFLIDNEQVAETSRGTIAGAGQPQVDAGQRQVDLADKLHVASALSAEDRDIVLASQTRGYSGDES
jgi:hypothetical protein